MKYQVTQMVGNKFERIAVIDATNRTEANEKMAQMAKERESILYLGYYSETRPNYHNMVIATATHTGQIINY